MCEEKSKLEDIRLDRDTVVKGNLRVEGTITVVEPEKPKDEECCDVQITLKEDAAKRFLEIMGEKSCRCKCRKCKPYRPLRSVYPRYKPTWFVPPYGEFEWSSSGDNDSYTITYSSSTQ